MTENQPIRDILAEHLGATIKDPVTLDLNADPDEGWTPPALNDNRALKAQIMGAIRGEPAPRQNPQYDNFKDLAASIQAGIDRLNAQNEGK